jgi:hypothetical protein
MADVGNFDARFCGRVCKIAAAVSVALVLGAAAIFLTANSASTRCPGWMLIAENGTSTPIYLIAFMQAVAAAWMCFLAFNWKSVARTIDHHIRATEQALATGSRADQFWAMPAVLLDTNILFTIVCVGWVAFCSIPLALIFLKRS